MKRLCPSQEHFNTVSPNVSSDSERALLAEHLPIGRYFDAAVLRLLVGRIAWA